MTDERISSIEGGFTDLRKIVANLARQSASTDKLVNQVATKLDVYLENNEHEDKNLISINKALNDLVVKVAEMPHRSGQELRQMLNPMGDKLRALELKMSQQQTEELQARIDVERRVELSLWSKARNHVRMIWAIFIFAAPIAGTGLYYVERDIRADIQSARDYADEQFNKRGDAQK